MPLGFVVCCGITVIWSRTMKGPRDALFYMGSRFGLFCVLLLKKNNMLLCVKNHVNMYLRDVLTWKW